MLSVSEAGVNDWAVLVTALTPVTLAVVAFLQWYIGRRDNKSQQQILRSVERTENMAERNTRKLHDEPAIPEEEEVS